MSGSTCFSVSGVGVRRSRVTAEEVVGGQAQLQRGLGRLLGRGRAVLPGEREHAEQAPDSRLAVLAVDLLAQRAQVRPGVTSSLQQRLGGSRRARRAVVLVQSMQTALLAKVFS